MSRSRRFIGWFLVITIAWYTQSSMATSTLKSLPKLEQKKIYNQGLTNLSKPILQEQNNQGFVGREYNIEKHHDHVMRGQRGKGTGVYGGANVAHRQPTKNSASLPAAKPTNLINTLNIVIMLHFILVSSLFFIN